MNDVAKGLLSKLVRPDRRDVVDWAETNVVFPKSVRSTTFRKSTSPWIAKPLESFRKNIFTGICKCTQATGTASAEVGVVYTVANRPGDGAIMAQTNDHAEKLVKDKFLPTLKASPATAAVFATLPRYAIKKDSITLPNMTIQIHGPNLNATQSASLTWVIIDEVWLLRHQAPQAIFSMLERGGASPENFHLMCVSQAGEELVDKYGNPRDDEWGHYWKMGTREAFSFRCPNKKCGQLFEPLTEHFRCDPAAKLEGGGWNWGMVEETTHLVTPCCGHIVEDTPENRRSLADNAEYVPANPHPINGHGTFRWNCWVVYWKKWGINLRKFLLAIEAMKRGDLAPLKEWTMKMESRWWTQKMEEPPPFELRSFGYKMADLGTGVPEDVIERLMGVDVQADRLEFVIRDFRPGGASRLVFTGEAGTWQELATIAGRYGLHRKKYRVFVDCGEGNRTQEVFTQCDQRDWLAIRGRNTGKDTMWTHKDKIQRPWSPVRYGHIVAHRGHTPVGGRKKQATKGNKLKGKAAYFYEIADVHFEDWLTRLVAGDGLEWEYADDIPSTYRMDSVRKVTTPGGVTKYVEISSRPNHKRDCEKYILGGACIIGTVFPELPQSPSEDGETQAED